MGEVAICGGSEMVFRVGGMEMAQRMENQDKATGSVSSSAAIWERFLPKLVVRVLLVEADYSTRQIIAALLRKCGYRVVAVGDGLTAWEILRGRPSSVDLILTEVDVPLISGYALLTLIMDHEICKKISVIMMSPHDKVSSVYKCMSKGATDFLVKPVRKNELNNLWQHVWRKQASSNAVGLGLVNGNVVQKMDRGTAENKAASYNNSSQCVGCVHQSRESTKKSTDAQSSCTKPESGNDGDADHLHTSSHLESSKCSDACTNKDRCEEDKALQLGDASGISSTEVINSTEASNNHPLIGVGTSASDSCSKEVDVLPQLDSLVRRPLQNCLVNEPTNKRPRLNHSESSPFSRYINKALQLGTSDDAAIFANQAPEEQKHASTDGVVGTRQGENTSSHSPNRELSDTVRGVGIRYENAFNEDSSLPSDCQTLSSLHSSNSIDHTDLKHCDKLDNMETGDDVNLISGAMSHHQSTCSVSNGNIVSTSINIAPPQCSNEEGYQVQSSHLHIFSRREAALTKFRLKRKDRCFEKKIRYESRKKLADQRPRVKGQFVRHVASVTTHGEISGDQLQA